MSWNDLIGKKVVALRGHPETTTRGVECPLSYVLFDDQETYLQFEEQDPHDYHDCAYGARTPNLLKDARMWAQLFNKFEGWYAEPTNSACPF